MLENIEYTRASLPKQPSELFMQPDLKDIRGLLKNSSDTSSQILPKVSLGEQPNDVKLAMAYSVLQSLAQALPYTVQDVGYPSAAGSFSYSSGVTPPT